LGDPTATFLGERTRPPDPAATVDATPMFREWSDRLWADQPVHQRLLVFQGQGDETRFIDSAAV
jgi:hypothetical protein